MWEGIFGVLESSLSTFSVFCNTTLILYTFTMLLYKTISCDSVNISSEDLNALSLRLIIP